MSIIQNSKWAQSVEGRPIELYSSYSLPSKDPSMRPILIIGGVHGDEPEGVFLAEKTLEWLQIQEKDGFPVPWILIPCINPDGYAKKQRGNANGVDLNRNYPSHDWSPSFDAERYNPGPGPASEPEIQALIQLVQSEKPRLFMHYHSWNPCVVCTGETGREDAMKLSSSSGYSVTENIGYDTPGGLSRWGWSDLKTPVICVEEAEKQTKEETWENFGEGIKAILLDDSPNNPRNNI